MLPSTLKQLASLPRSTRLSSSRAVRVRGGKPVAEYTRLVKPSAPLDPYVSELTGITDEMLESAAPIAAELPAFFDFVAADVIVGHSVAYDVNFLYDSAERCGLSVPTNDYVDTLRLSRRLYGRFARPQARHGRAVSLA